MYVEPKVQTCATLITTRTHTRHRYSTHRRIPGNNLIVLVIIKQDLNEETFICSSMSFRGVAVCVQDKHGGASSKRLLWCRLTTGD